MAQNIENALYTGEKALKSLRMAQGILKSAGNWGLLDMFGGGLLTTWMKHSKLNEAEEVLAEVRENLRAFTNAAKMLQGTYTLKIEIGEFMRVADYLLDGLFVDYLVYSKIADARREVDDAIFKLEGLLGKLRNGYRRY